MSRKTSNRSGNLTVDLSYHLNDLYEVSARDINKTKFESKFYSFGWNIPESNLIEVC